MNTIIIGGTPNTLKASEVTLAEHEKSLTAEPPIKPGTPDPYVPAKQSK